jgi:hypothetical protein
MGGVSTSKNGRFFQKGAFLGKKSKVRDLYGKSGEANYQRQRIFVDVGRFKFTVVSAELKMEQCLA